MKVTGNDKHSNFLGHGINGTAHFKNVNNCLNNNFHFYLEASGGQSSDLHLNVHFFNTCVN